MESERRYGTVVSALVLVVVVIFAAIALTPVVAGDPPLHKQRHALSHIKQLGTALHIYLADYDDAFPPAAADFQEVVNVYITNESVFSFPRPDGLNVRFKYNRNIGGLSSAKIVDLSGTVAVFGGATLPKAKSTSQEILLSFTDTHVRGFSPNEADNHVWNPFGTTIREEP